LNCSEAREPLTDFLVRQDTGAERRLAFDILVEYDLGTRQQANRNVRLPDRRESANNRVVEFRRHQAFCTPAARSCRPAKQLLLFDATHTVELELARREVVRPAAGSAPPQPSSGGACYSAPLQSKILAATRPPSGAENRRLIFGRPKNELATARRQSMPKGHFRAASTAWASARPARRDCAMM
jgi:hypothetical protein